MPHVARRSMAVAALFAFTACPKDIPRHAVGGTATGLTGTGLVLQNNGGDDLAIPANGRFAFPTPIPEGQPYVVTVKVQPTSPPQNCAVVGGAGIVAHADVTSVTVVCQRSPAVYVAASEGATAPLLWRTDGTAAGTGLVAGAPGSGEASHPDALGVVADQLYFAADHLDGALGLTEALWRTDGSALGTRPIKALSPSGPTLARPGLVECAGRGYFGARAPPNDFDQELWMTDGTPAGTTMVADVQPGPYGSDPRHLTCLGATLFFFAHDGTHGLELWRSDGTAAGTAIVKDIDPGVYQGIWERWPPIAFGGELYFMASDGYHGYELWKTDGTAAGTVMVKDLNPGGGSSQLVGGRAVFDGALYFAGFDGALGPELWKTDGTEAGTVLVKDICPGPVGSHLDDFVVFGGALYFTAMDGVHGFELWKTDGTAAGTVMVQDICPGACDSWPSGKTAGPGALFFQANDGVHGTELWRTDGTSTGTALVTDLVPGAMGSSPYGITSLGPKIFFGASTGSGTSQMWMSDGTEAGTATVPLVCPQAGCSMLYGFSFY